MNNLNKFQKKMFDELLMGNRVVFGETEDGKVILTNGYEAYIFFKNEIFINLEKCKKADDLKKITTPNENDRQIEITNNFYNSGRGMCCEFKADDGMKIWIQEKFVKPFGGCIFKAYSPIQRVLVYDMHSRLIGLVLPMRIGNASEE
jgi:hypothetical protein